MNIVPYTIRSVRKRTNFNGLINKHMDKGDIIIYSLKES